MKRWKVALIGGAALAAIAAAVAVGTAVGAAGTSTATAAASTVATQSTPAATPSTDPRAQMQDLMKNKAFRDELFALRRTQLDALQAWWNTYAADPQSTAAQTAMDQLRQSQQTAMAGLLKKYGVTLPTPPAHNQQLEKLKNNAQFRADFAKLREQMRADMQAWFKRYGSDPRSAAAVAAMKTLRTQQQTALKALFTKYGVTLNGHLMGPGMMGRGFGGGFRHGFGPGKGFDGPLGGGMMDGGPLGGGMMGSPAGAASGSAI